MMKKKNRINLDKPIVEIARSYHEIEKLRSTWLRLEKHPNVNFEYYRTICDSRLGFIRPHVIVIRRNETVEAMLVGRIEEISYVCKFGYREIYRTKVRSLNFLYGGLLGSQNSEIYKLLISSVLRSLKEGEAELSYFNQLPLDSEFRRQLKKSVSFVCHDYFQEVSVHWRMSVPESLEKFYHNRSKNFRRNLVRYSNKLKNKFGSDEVEFKRFDQLVDFETVIKDTEQIASRTYHRGLGLGFSDNTENRQRILYALKRNIFIHYILYIKKKPCAFLNGIQYRETFYPWYTAYDPTYRNLSIGTLVFMDMVKDLINDHEMGIKYVDFGFGDADYKHRYCDQNWLEVSIFIFPPTLNGIKLNLIKSMTKGVERLAKSILNGIGILPQVKRRWRDSVLRG